MSFSSFRIRCSSRAAICGCTATARWPYSGATFASPSLLGRELFRARVSSYSAGTFEDAVIFVHDVEQCLEDLNQFDRKVLGKVVFQDYTQDEAAHLLGCGRKKIWRRVPEILDVVSEKLLEHGLLYRFPVKT